MEQEIKIPEGNTLISVAIPISWVKEKKRIGYPWRRIIKEGINHFNKEEQIDAAKQYQLRLVLESELQQANKKLSEYQQILVVRK